MKISVILGALCCLISAARAQVAGTLDSAYNPNPNSGGDTAVYSSAMLSNGETIIGGNFTTVAGAGHINLAVLHADGSLNENFTASTNGQVFSVAVQADGKILIGGLFTQVNGEARNYIARLNADGTLESTATFDPGSGANYIVDCIAVQADGKIVIGGHFTR